MTSALTAVSRLGQSPNGNAPGAGGASSAGTLAVFDRIADPMVAVEKLGDWFFKSGLFGLANPSQGHVVAMACLCDRVNPMEIGRRYHVIEGRLSMKAEAMLAGFHERGGKHRIVERSPEAAEIELTPPGGDPVKFRFTWEEAKQESFPYRNGKDGDLKNNWRTPRGRMQMLWARAVSDGVRAIMPGVVVGTYTPEEIGDMPAALPEGGADSGSPADVRAARRAELAELDRQARMEEAPPFAPTTSAASVADDVIDVQPEMPTTAALPAAPASEAPLSPPCSMEQLQQLASLGEQCGLSRDVLKKHLCEAAGVENPAQMTDVQADELIRRLEETLEKKRST